MHQGSCRSILIVLCMVAFMLGCSLMASGQTIRSAWNEHGRVTEGCRSAADERAATQGRMV
jgi:hypothetical protein